MDIDLVSVTEAMQIMNLSKSQVLWLCNNGRLDEAKKFNDEIKAAIKDATQQKQN
ncbi:MAG: hypothetical protein IJP56_09250 [Synergistaceae bacterium]|nr:hypothetical protein [Synergistaceae bacterium]MBR0096721.1 hypothetical protein [Synergistaceae bacterium]